MLRTANYTLDNNNKNNNNSRNMTKEGSGHTNAGGFGQRDAQDIEDNDAQRKRIYYDLIWSSSALSIIINNANKQTSSESVRILNFTFLYVSIVYAGISVSCFCSVMAGNNGDNNCVTKQTTKEIKISFDEEKNEIINVAQVNVFFHKNK